MALLLKVIITVRRYVNKYVKEAEYGTCEILDTVENGKTQQTYISGLN